MIVDVHVHAEPGATELNPAVARAAQRLGIERLCVSSLGDWSYVPTTQQCVAANDQTLALMRRHPDLVWGLCYVNPAAEPIWRGNTEHGWRQEVERCLQEGMVGIKLWVAVRCASAPARALIEHAIERDVPVQLHTWWKMTGNLPHESRPEEAAELSRLYPQAKLIVAHLGGDWQRGVAALRDTNACADTSGSIVERGMIERAVAVLGADRVIFGSDSAGATLAGTLAKITGARIGEEDKRKVLGLNALRLLARC